MSEEKDVTAEDQDMINQFGRLNNRLLELRADVKQIKTDAEKLDDASTELMMAEGGRIMLLIGEAFVEVSEDYASEYCERKQSALASRVQQLGAEEGEIVKTCEALKKELYARFGDSINLEN